MARIPKRYARALFNLRSGDLATAKKDSETLSGLKSLFDQKEGGRVLRSPVMPADLKKQILDYGLTQLGASEDVKRLVSTVLEAGRVALLPEIADELAASIAVAEGRVKAHVTSAAPLKPEDVKQIEGALAQIFNKKIDIDAAVDRSVLGGFVVRVGNYRIDMSLQTKLAGLAQAAVNDTQLSI